MDVCTLAPDSPRANQGDGVDGIDNSFGQNIVPLLAAVSPNPSSSVNAAFAAGTSTLMIDVVGLDESDPTQSATGLSAQWFTGALFDQAPDASSAVPTFTTADDWPLDPASVASGVESGGALAQPVVGKTVFTSSYVVDGTFVSGTTSEVTLVLPFGGALLAVKIQHPVITFVSGGTHAGSGIVSGVVLTNDLIGAMQSIAGNIATSFCGTADGGTSPAFDQIVVAIQQSQDIMHDGTNSAGVPCDAISIGVGFDADEIALPQAWGATLSPANPCQ
jgi:hypothetical protein